MALSKTNDNLMGVETTTYNRIKNISIENHENKTISLHCQKYSSEEYREKNPSDGKPFNLNGTLTDEEYEIVMGIMYAVAKREFGGDDC